MITQMLYPDEISMGTGKSPWYQPYQTAANRHHLLSNQEVDLTGKMSAPLNRQEMAFILAQAAEDLDAELDTPGALSGQNRIPDLAFVPEVFQNSVELIYQLGIMAGVDHVGTFSGSRNMTRAQAAVVLCPM